MKMIAVIDKADVIEKILNHIGLWVEDEGASGGNKTS